MADINRPNPEDLLQDIVKETKAIRSDKWPKIAGIAAIVAVILSAVQIYLALK